MGYSYWNCWPGRPHRLQALQAIESAHGYPPELVSVTRVPEP